MTSGSDLQQDVLAEIRNLDPIECGKDAAKHFAFDDEYTNLNHGTVKAILRNLR